MARGYPDGKPRLYAKEKLKTLQKRKDDPVIGPATSRMAAIAFPDAPPEVFHGFTAFTESPAEDTAEAGNAFHEVGLYQVEAGLSSGPAPNPDPSAEYSNWTKLAGSDLVQSMLGRSATVVKGAWKTALEDQIAVGLANLRYHADLMSSALLRQLKSHGLSQDLADQIRPANPSSSWGVMWAFTAFSRGEGQFFAVLQPYLADLAESTEEQRWLHLRRLVLRDIANRSNGIGGKPGKSGAAYALIRTEQKYQSGYLLSQKANSSTEWFNCAYSESDEDLQMEDQITKVAYPK